MTDAEHARRAHAAGDVATASAHYERALAAAPGDATLMFDYAVLLMQTARTQEAAALLRARSRSPACSAHIAML